MKKSIRGLSVFTVLILIMACWIMLNPDLAQAEASGGLDQHFQKARINFIKQNYVEASSEIRQGARLLKLEAEKTKGKAKQTLLSSARELDTLSEEVVEKNIASLKNLDEAFARTHQSVAGSYHWQASESWDKNAVKEAGHYLKLAALHIEEALTWMGRRIETSSASAIQDARQVAKKMEQDANWTLDEIRKGMASLRKEIDEAGYQSSKSSGIKVSEKPSGPTDLSIAITRVAKQNIPAIVYIEVEKSPEIVNPHLPFEDDPFFRRFFGVPGMPRKFKQELKLIGSGMIFDTQGHILTNYHVVGRGTKIQVTLANGEKYPAQLVGGDLKTDIAVIQISSQKQLPQVTFGDSDRLNVGQWVVAIGAPRSLEKTVTKGIISAMHRKGMTDPKNHQDFIQTDAAINPGNSGGPLLNLNGEVIGVNTAIVTESGGFEGIGFTIPSNMALHVARALITHGKVERGWLE